MKDYYKILRIHPSATEDEIKEAYRRMAHRHHPDKGGDPEKFKEIHEAYETLSDSTKRRAYDNAFHSTQAPPQSDDRERSTNSATSHPIEKKKTNHIGVVITVILAIAVLYGIFSNLGSSTPQTASQNNSYTPSPINSPVVGTNSASINLPINILETSDGATGEGTYTDQYPQSITVDNVGVFADEIAAYGASYHVWIGPTGWTGTGGVGVDGNINVNLYPMNSSNDTGSHIGYSEVPGCYECMLDGAAPFFTDAMQSYNQTYNQNGSEPVTVPQGIQMVSISPTLITYTLPAGYGYITQGVVYYSPNAQSHVPFEQANFTLPQNDSDLLNFLLKTFISREGLN
jgi:hypothetical protein